MSGPFLKVDEIPYRRSGAPFNADGSREYKRKFQVIVDDPTIGPLGVCYAPDLPRPFEIYNSGSGEYDLAALAIRFEAEQTEDDDWQVWEVTITYSTQMPPGGQPELPGTAGGPGATGEHSKGSQNNPEMEPPDIEWDMEVVNKAPQFDRNGKPFLNSANQPFTPAPTFEVAYPVLVYSRNELTFDVLKAARYAYAVNSDKFLGAPPGAAQCLPPKAKVSFRGPIQYWRTTYRIRFAKHVEKPNNDPNFPWKGPTLEWEGWQPKILDAGLCELEKDPLAAAERKNKPKNILGSNGSAISSPVCLDGKGSEAKPKLVQPIPLGDIFYVVTPTYIDFEMYNKQPFAKLLVRGV